MGKTGDKVMEYEARSSRGKRESGCRLSCPACPMPPSERMNLFTCTSRGDAASLAKRIAKLT